MTFLCFQARLVSCHKYWQKRVGIANLQPPCLSHDLTYSADLPNQPKYLEYLIKQKVSYGVRSSCLCSSSRSPLPSKCCVYVVQVLAKGLADRYIEKRPCLHGNHLLNLFHGMLLTAQLHERWRKQVHCDRLCFRVYCGSHCGV